MKIDFNQKMKEIIKNLDHRPTLVLHSCCAPCATYPLTILDKYFDITILYSNSNIYPLEEYQKRLNELKNYLFKNYPHIKLVEYPYDNENYMKQLEKWKDEKEGGLRCFKCYSLRIEDAFKYASKNNIEYVCTVLSVSRWKNSLMINKIGNAMSKKYPSIKFLYSDFKKEKGTEIGAKIAKENNLYRQQYCGCIYSYQESKKRHN